MTGTVPKSAPANAVAIAYSKGANSARTTELCIEQLPPGPAVPTFLLVFVGGKHAPEGVLNTLKARYPHVPVAGGSAAGVITQHGFGYTGLEIGIAAWYDKATTPRLYVTDKLLEGDYEGGRELGLRARADNNADAPIILLYDSVHTAEPRKLHAAASLLAGFRAEWGDTNLDLVGGGLLTDLNLTDGWVYTGTEAQRHAAVALVFPRSFESRTSILRACRPVSVYMEITGINGAEVAQLDGRPALDVIEEHMGRPLVGANGEITEIMTLGQKFGDPFDPGTPEDYISRLIIAADLERRSVTLFEPDFAAGTYVQLMASDNEIMLESARDGAAAARRLNLLPTGIRPAFRLYIDCAGRASVVTRADPEEARVVIDALATDNVPLLGFYSGVEIAQVLGEPRPLDWTGVLTTMVERAGHA